MAPMCAVYGCNRTKGRHALEDDGKTPLNFFSFPAFGTSGFKQWVHACGRSDLKRSHFTYRVVCSRHFSSCAIAGNRLTRPRLIKDAVPTQNLPHELSHSAHLLSTVSADMEIQHSFETVVKHDDGNDSFEISEVSSVGTGSVHPVSGDGDSVHPSLATVVKHEDRNDSFEISEMSGVGTDSVHPVSDDGDSVHPNLATVVKHEYRNDSFEISGVSSVGTDSVHPISDIGDSVAHWFCSGKDGETTWYFQAKVLNEGPPQVTRSVRITEGCRIPEFFIGSVPLKRIQAECILVNRNINNREEFIAVLMDFCEITVSTHLLQSAISILEAAVTAYECEELEDPNCMLLFVREQLKMCLKPPTLRRWNPAVLRWARLLHSHSPAAYQFLSTSGFLLVPCEKTLARRACSNIPFPGMNDDIEK